MKHIKKYSEIFENKKGISTRDALSDDQIDFLDKYTRGSWVVNPETGLVDIRGDFKLKKYQSESFMGIKFGVVHGNFDFSRNNIKSLVGSPIHVEGSFSFELNQVESLEGAPRKVGETFDCSYNPLKPLEGSPEEVENFYCTHTHIGSLEGSPNKIRGDFNCSYNDELISLKGSPERVEGGFRCYNTGIKTLVGGPNWVGYTFNCSYNKLSNLKGSPRYVGDDFICLGKYLVSLDGIPDTIRGYVFLPDGNKFRGTREGMIEAMLTNRIMFNLISKIIKFEDLVDEVSKNPLLLNSIERFDKVLYEKILKILGWDKMGTDLLRQLKNGII